MEILPHCVLHDELDFFSVVILQKCVIVQSIDRQALLNTRPIVSLEEDHVADQGRAQVTVCFFI